MTADPKLLAARARVLAARERLDASIGLAKARLSPASLASDAMDGVRSKASEIATSGVDVVRQRPAAVACVAAALGLFLARKPIARVIGRDGATGDETGDA